MMRRTVHVEERHLASAYSQESLRWYMGHAGNPFQHLNPVLRESLEKSMSRTARPAAMPKGGFDEESIVPEQWRHAPPPPRPHAPRPPSGGVEPHGGPQ